MYSLSYRQAIHTRRRMLQSSARLFTECAAASIVPRFVACCKVFPSQGRPPLVQHRTAWCQEMAHPLLNTLTCWWPSPWRILLANPKGGGLTPALSTAWRGSRRREFASSIQRAAASPQPSPLRGEGADGESSPAVSKGRRPHPSSLHAVEREQTERVRQQYPLRGKYGDMPPQGRASQNENKFHSLNHQQ